MIRRGVSVDTSEEEKEHEEGGEEENGHHPMEIEGQFVTEELSPHIEETHEEPSSQAHQLQEGHSMQERHPSQERPLAWFLEYFEKLNATMERIEQHQEQQEMYIERLGYFYKKMYEQQIDFNQQYNDRMTVLQLNR